MKVDCIIDFYLFIFLHIGTATSYFWRTRRSQVRLQRLRLVCFFQARAATSSMSRATKTRRYFQIRASGFPHSQHISNAYPQLSFQPFTAPACTPRPPSPALIRCLSSCTIPQPRLSKWGLHCQRINALSASWKGASRSRNGGRSVWLERLS